MPPDRSTLCSLRGPDPRHQGRFGLRNLPLKSFAQNQLWCEIVALACELLGLDPDARPHRDRPAGNPDGSRLRLFSVAGRLARSARRLRLNFAQRWPWADQITAAVTRLQALPGRLTSSNHHCDTEGSDPGPVEPARPARQPGSQPRPGPENNHQPNS